MIHRKQLEKIKETILCLEKNEVDLVFESRGEITGYEFKYGKKQTRPPKSFQEAYQAKVYSVNSDIFLTTCGKK